MSRYIDADKILSSIGLSYKAACEWEDKAILEEYKARANAEAIAYLECYLRIKEMPIADVQLVKHGKWIRTGWQRGGYGKPKTEIEYECSACWRNKIYKRKTQKLPNYCGSCGAKMDGEEK